MEADGEALAVPGVREVLLDLDQRPVAVIETYSPCSVVRLADVDDRHAIDEGEGYADAAAFRLVARALLERLHRRSAAQASGLTSRSTTTRSWCSSASRSWSASRPADPHDEEAPHAVVNARMVVRRGQGLRLVRSYDALPVPAGLR